MSTDLLADPIGAWASATLLRMMLTDTDPPVDLERIVGDARASLDLYDETILALVLQDEHADRQQVAMVLEDPPDDVEEQIARLGRLLDHGGLPPVVIVRPRFDGCARRADEELLGRLQRPRRAIPVLGMVAVGWTRWEEVRPTAA